MKRIKSIFAAILLMLLLTSISQAWQPPSVNGPIAISETDEDPWGGTLVSHNRTDLACRSIQNTDKLQSEPIYSESDNIFIWIIQLASSRHIVPLLITKMVSLDDKKSDIKNP